MTPKRTTSRQDEALQVAAEHVAWFQRREHATLNDLRAALGFSSSRSEPSRKRAQTVALVAAIWMEKTKEPSAPEADGGR